jgi:hypothetical protein
MATYCSKACQLADWEKHKPCHDNCAKGSGKSRSISRKFNDTIPTHLAQRFMDKETWSKLQAKGGMFRATLVGESFHIHPMTMKEWVEFTMDMYPDDFKKHLKCSFEELKLGRLVFVIFCSKFKPRGMDTVSFTVAIGPPQLLLSFKV